MIPIIDFAAHMDDYQEEYLIISQLGFTGWTVLRSQLLIPRMLSYRSFLELILAQLEVCDSTKFT